MHTNGGDKTLKSVSFATFGLDLGSGHSTYHQPLPTDQT